MKRLSVQSSVLVTIVVAVASTMILAQVRNSVTTKGPLPIEMALKLSQYGEIDLSPDGEWLAYRSTDPQSGTQRLHVEELSTHRSIELGSRGANAGRPAWSPNSQRLAFFSNETGPPMLWIWDRESGKKRMIPGAEFPDETRAFSRWLSDGRRLVIPLWPEGDSRPAQSRAIGSTSPFRPPFAEVGPDQVSVFVHRTSPNPANGKGPPSGIRIDPATMPCEQYAYGRCDLGIVDIRSDRIERIATRVPLAWFHRPSPDDRYIGYATFKGMQSATQLAAFDLHVVEIETRHHRIVARDRYDLAGLTFTWSPDSRHIAHVSLRADYEDPGERDRVRPADLSIISIADVGHAITFGNQSLPVFSGRVYPLWNAQSTKLYALNLKGEPWEVDITSGNGRPASSLSGISELIRPNETGVWSTTSDKVLALAANAKNSASGIYEINLQTGAAEPVLRRPQDFRTGIDVSAKTGTIAFVTSDQQSPGDLWLLRRGEQNATKVGGLNRFLADVALGQSRTITWVTDDGRQLAGALLLPPGYQSGTRVPLFVWVYGGRMGSELVNYFGFTSGPAFNAQILASRGYAVLHPDAPQRVGTPMRDLFTTVMPGIDAAIEYGIADPDRLAIGGHSYGSFSTLALITQTRRFKAAVISGVENPDLVSHYLRMRSTGSSSEDWAETGQGLMGGPPWQYPDRYRENSTIYRFEKIETPLLIGQGEIDPITPITGANAVFVALRRLGKPVEYRIYEGEGHNFLRPAHVIDFWNRRLEFLAEHLNIELDAEGRVILESGRARPRAGAR